METRCPATDDPFPARLYRYLSWRNCHHKRLLTENEIYFAKVSSFNDPFDSQFEIDWQRDDPQLLRKGLEDLAERHFPALCPCERSSCVEKRLAEILAPAFEKQEARRRTARMDQGFCILCLSETRSNPLMWAYYADSHRGICVGFDSDGLQEVGKGILDAKEFGSDIMKVQYCKKFPVFDVANPPDPGEMVLPVVRSKAPDWSYEKEYRFVVGLKDDTRTWHYANAVLVEVILGCRIGPTDEQEIREILRKKTLGPALLKAVRRRGEYALDFHPVQY